MFNYQCTSSTTVLGFGGVLSEKRWMGYNLCYLSACVVDCSAWVSQPRSGIRSVENAQTQGAKVRSTVTLISCFGATHLVNTHRICFYRRYAATRLRNPGRRIN